MSNRPSSRSPAPLEEPAQPDPGAAAADGGGAAAPEIAPEIARYYDKSKNPNGATFPGVPLRDLTPAEWDGLPAWLRASVDASPFYRKTKLSAAAPEPGGNPLAEGNGTDG